MNTISTRLQKEHLDTMYSTENGYPEIRGTFKRKLERIFPNASVVDNYMLEIPLADTTLTLSIEPDDNEMTDADLIISASPQPININTISGQIANLFSSSPNNQDGGERHKTQRRRHRHRHRKSKIQRRRRNTKK
jgi:hypothetical protein